MKSFLNSTENIYIKQPYDKKVRPGNIKYAYMKYSKIRTRTK